MKIIYKFKLRAVGQQEIEMSKNAEILCLETQFGEPCIWTLVETDDEQEIKSFFIVGTGEPMPENPSKYIGTYQKGEFVFHVFELL